MRIVSACLAGIWCRFDDERIVDPRVEALVAAGEALPVCPEQLGGLPTPRTAAGVVSSEPWRLINENGTDVTAQYLRGAEETVRLARLIGAHEAILKENSPSCGSCKVRVADISGPRREWVAGEGVTASMLRRMGVNIFSEENWLGLTEGEIAVETPAEGD